MSRISCRRPKNISLPPKPHVTKRAVAAAGLLLLSGCANMAWNDASPKKRNVLARIVPDEIFTIPVVDALGAGGNNGAAIGNPIAAVAGFFVGIVEFPVCWIREMVTGESPSNRDLIRAIDRSGQGK